MKKNYYLLTAGGVDKKGIVFKLSGILKENSFNIEDSSMLMLRGTFSVIMLLSHAKATRSKKFMAELKKFATEFDMTVDIKTISEKEMRPAPHTGETYMISISGADKPGIVNAMTAVIVEKGGNKIDLETKSSQKTTPPAYYMLLEVDMPKKDNAKKLEAALKKTGSRIGVHVSVNKAEKEIL